MNYNLKKITGILISPQSVKDNECYTNRTNLEIR